MHWTENKKKLTKNWPTHWVHRHSNNVGLSNCLTHFTISELPIQIRHYRGATRTDWECYSETIVLCSEMLLGNDLDNFHNFFHQLLVLWINHVVLLLMSQLVHIFSSTMLSFVSTSSLTVFVFPQVRQSQSGCCRCFASRTQAPHSRIIGSKIAHRPSQTCNRPTIDLLRIFQISPTHSQTHSTRLPGSFVSGITLSLDTWPLLTWPLDLWRSAFTGSIDSARSQPILLLLQLLRLLKAFQRSWSVCCWPCCNGSIHQDVRHQASIAMFSIICCCCLWRVHSQCVCPHAVRSCKPSD